MPPAVLDYLSDFICCLYGKPGAYGGCLLLNAGVEPGGGIGRLPARLPACLLRVSY